MQVKNKNEMYTALLITTLSLHKIQARQTTTPSVRTYYNEFSAAINVVLKRKLTLTRITALITSVLRDGSCELDEKRRLLIASTIFAKEIAQKVAERVNVNIVMPSMMRLALD